MVEEKESWFKKNKPMAIIGGIIILLLLIILVHNNSTGNVVNENQDIKENTQTIYICSDGSQVYDSSQCSSASVQAQDNTQNITTQPTQTTTQTPPVEEKSDKATIGEKNALSKALSYLDVLAFSYSGLIKQLEYEGYTHQESVYGVDNCGANWNEQAALKAQSYLDVMAFSKDGLIEQLEYEGFTREQAEYGVQTVGY